MIWNNISFLLSMHTPFLFGIQLKSVETTHRKKKMCAQNNGIFCDFVISFFSMFWSLGTIRINPYQIWIILPLGHHVFIKYIKPHQTTTQKKKTCAVFFGDVRFSIQRVKSLRMCNCLLLLSETCPSIKGCSFPNKR